MKAKKIIDFLEEKYPKSNAEEWDNVGLLVGNINKDIKKIQLSIDATEKAIEYAVENGINMIITHHPLIFKPLKSIVISELLGRKIIKLIENEIKNKLDSNNIESPFLNKQQACKYLGIANNTLDSWIKKGLPVIRVGKTVRFDKTELNYWLQNQ